MAFTPDQQTRIMAVIGEHAPEAAGGACRVCQQTKGYTVAPGFVFFPLQETTQALSWTGNGIPCVVLTCQFCANTLFFNMLRLGLDDLVNPSPDQSRIPPFGPSLTRGIA
jgi:hypothetical protein